MTLSNVKSMQDHTVSSSSKSKTDGLSLLEEHLAWHLPVPHSFSPDNFLLKLKTFSPIFYSLMQKGIKGQMHPLNQQDTACMYKQTSDGFQWEKVEKTQPKK